MRNQIKVLKETIFVIMIIMTTSGLFAQSQVQVLNIDDFAKTVRDNNLQLKIAKKEKHLKEKTKREALAALLPQVNFEGIYQRNFNEQNMYIEFPDFSQIDPITGEIPVTLQKFGVSFKNDYQANFLLEQNLISIKSLYDLKASHIYSDMEELKLTATVNEVMCGAKKIFLQTALMEQVYKLNQLSEKNAHENYLSAENKYQNKLISEMDFLQAKIRWENEIPKAKQAKRNYHTLLANLKVIAGFNAGDSIQLFHKFFFHPDKISMIPAADALDKREDYQMLLNNISLHQTNIRREKAEFLPTISAQLGYSYLSSSNRWKTDENMNKPYYANLTLSFPIFSGGYRNTQVQKARINYQISKLQKKEAEQAIRIEIKDLELKLREEAEIIKSAEVTLSTAQKGHELAKNNMETGLISQMDLREYSEDLKKAQLNLYYAIYNYECTKIDYNKAIGNDE